MRSLKQINLEQLKIPISFIIAFLFIVNSGFHIKGVPTYITMYCTFYLAVIYLFIKGFKKLYIENSISIYICLIWILYLISTQFFVGGDIIVLLAAIVTFIFYILTKLLLNKCPIQKALIISEGMMIYNALLFLVDAIYRFSNIGLNVLNNFYLVKTNSLLYADTNAVGINSSLLTLYAFYLYKTFKSSKYLIYIYLFIIFTILTFSRAAMCAILFSFLILYSYNSFFAKRHYKISFRKFPVKILILIPFILIMFAIILFIAQFLVSDASFLTKINIFEYISIFFDKMPIHNLLFGIGFDNTSANFGLYAHTYLATYIIETGILGYFLITFFLLSILAEHRKTIYLLLPFFFLGFSYIGHTILNLFYVLLAMIGYFEKSTKKQQVEKN